jgi:integrase
MSMPRTPGRIEKRGDNKYLLRVFTGRDGNGKRRYINQTFHGTAKEAQKALRQLLRDKDLGLLVEAERMTLNEFLDKWLETSVKPHLRVKTYRGYKSSLGRYFREPLGAKRLGKVTTMDIQSVYADMLSKKLAPATVIYAHAVIREALQQAVKWQMLTRNPADFVDLPKQRGRPEMYAMNQEEIARFRAVAKPSKWYVLFELMLGTGLRPSEALGLTWRNVDLAKGTLAVVQTLAKHNNSDWKFEDPKTQKGRRSITLPASIVTLLSEHMTAQKALGLPNPHNLLFHNIEGLPASENPISQNVFKPLIIKAGLSKQIRMYDLRHTHATLLLLAGVHPKVVSERLGHSSIVITLNTYSHVLPNMQAEAAEKLEAFAYGVPVIVEAPKTDGERVQN